MGLPVSWYVIGGLVVALGVQHFHVGTLNNRIGERDLAIANANKAALQLKTDTENRWRKENEKLDTEYQAKLATVRADLALANESRDGLRDSLRRFTSRARDTCPTAPGEAIRTDDPIGVLADVLSRADAVAEVFARTADERGTAGWVCEVKYDVLKQGVILKNPGGGG